jgi:hypothetical protein
MGDKDPAVMRWWAEHHPELYGQRYGHRVVPQVAFAPPQTGESFPPVMEEEDDGDPPRVITE